MLKTLTVLNFALIEQAIVDFTAGLNILTGETGAGKSILIDAFGVILGNRASTDHIRKGAEALRVEAVFDTAGNTAVSELLEGQEIAAEEDGTLIISRRFTRNGKNAITVNGCHVTLGFLRLLGQRLVDMHGQHQNQSLLRPETQRLLLDSFSTELKAKLELYRTVYDKWLAISRELTASESKSRERAQRLDMLKWQTDEIAAASLRPGEDSELAAQIKVLANAEKITASLHQAYSILNDGGKGHGAVIGGLAQIKRELETVVRYNSKFETQLTVITDALYQLEDCSRELRNDYESLEFNPQRLASLQARLELIDKLAKKYGPSTQDILDYYQQAQQELISMAGYDDLLDALGRQKDELERNLSGLARELTLLRTTNAAVLAEEIEQHLIHLGMPKAKLQIAVTDTGRFTAAGCNEISFLFSANAGEEPQAVHKVASGGELSRLALAIKTVCAARDNVGTMVFDEIDSGIGGQTAQMVAERIVMVAAAKQVLCITHLPQIAAMADAHIYLEKQADDERTITKIRCLTKAEQLTELARMLSGTVTDLALDNAAQMLQFALNKKEKWKNKA